MAEETQAWLKASKGVWVITCAGCGALSPYGLEEMGIPCECCGHRGITGKYIPPSELN